MSLIIVETTADQPMTPEMIKDADERVLPCLDARNATWRYSLLASDRQRMICTFDAPDAESVRDSYRRAGLPSRPIWSGDLIKPDTIFQPDSTMRYVMEGSYPALSEANWNEIRHKLLHYCAKHKIEWLQSYISRDRTRIIYELNASDIGSIQVVADNLGISGDRIWSAEVLKP
jgi:hypothetical protein